MNDKNYKNFVRYGIPKKGLFLVPDDDSKKEYCLKNGWPTKEVAILIIGEDEFSYVQRLLTGETGYWEGDQVIQYKTYTTVGPHKSRLIKWMPIQLTFF